MTREEITIPESAWQNVNDAGILKTTIWINGCPMHLEAHEVQVKGDMQTGRGGSSFDELHQAFEAEGHLQTVTIRGRTYALFALPFG